MGFKKEFVSQEVSIAMAVDVVDGNNVLDRATVVHTFRRPTMKERELYRSIAHKWVGGKPQLQVTKANLAIWDACIKSVGGYDDITDPENPEKFKPYFLGDDIGKAHADSAARILMDRIGEVEEELEKKSD